MSHHTPFSNAMNEEKILETGNSSLLNIMMTCYLREVISYVI